MSEEATRVETRPTRVRRLTAEEYVAGVLDGDRRILSRAVTLVESSRPDDRLLAQEVLNRLLPHAGKSVRLGLTGVPGAGKSTLIESFGLMLTEAGHRVAVLAIDPSSRKTGGSILGDKTRMARLSLDPNAFVRPSPSGETLGGVAARTREAMLLCEAAGYDVVIIETVGVGQSETVVSEMVDCFLVLLIAGAGDELQGIKRGLIEQADIIAVNKADGDNKPKVELAVRQYRVALHMVHPPGGLWDPPVVACSAKTQEGLTEIWKLIGQHRATLDAAGELTARRAEQRIKWMWSLVNDRIRSALRGDESVRNLTDRLEKEVWSGRLTAATASDLIIEALGIRA